MTLYRPGTAGFITAAAATVGVLAGCASLPVDNRVRQVDVGALPGAAQGSVQIVPKPPGDHWTQDQIVTGFLTASSSGDAAVAREYLAPSYRPNWRPGPTAIVVEATKVLSLPGTVHLPGGAPEVNLNVVLTSLATLTNRGNYVASSTTHTYSVQLSQVNGQWRIVHLPAALRDKSLLTESDFLRAYQPANAYFYPVASPNNVLVPDPVFVPNGLSAQDRARVLVDDLVDPPTDWLAGATTTAFPSGSVVESVHVLADTAWVNLGGNAYQANGNGFELQRMAAQLAWTLTSSPYAAAPVVQSVILEINGKPWPARTQLALDQYANWVPQPAGLVYFQTPNGLAAIQPGGKQSTTLPLPAPLAAVPLQAVAALNGGSGRQIWGCTATAIYSGQLGQARPAARDRAAPAGCTSLSWDLGENLWAASGGKLWVRLPGSGRFYRAPLPAGAGNLAVSSVRLAADGVRMAMIAHPEVGGKPRGSEVLIAGVGVSGGQPRVPTVGPVIPVGSGIPNPIALSWLDSDHLLVLSSTAAGEQLYVVPVNGGPAATVTTYAGTNSIGVTGGVVVAGVTAQSGTGQVFVARPSGWNWQIQHNNVSSAVFP